MTLQRITNLSLCATLALFAGACDLGEKSIGNETGADQGESGDGDVGDGDGDNGDGDGDQQPAFGSCGEETVTIVSDLDLPLPGFDGLATNYLEAFEGEFLGDFDWLPNDGPVTVAHAGTSSPLTVSVNYEGGEIRLTEVALVGEFPDDGNLGGELCSNVLEIDVTMTFATDDGLFAESFEIPIRVYSHAELTLPGFYFSLDMDALQGELALADFSFTDAEISDLVLLGNFDDGTLDGSLMMEVVTMNWVGFGPAGNFTAARQP